MLLVSPNGAKRKLEGGGGVASMATLFTKFSYLADMNAFAFSPLNLSNLLIFRIFKYSKVTEVNR